MLIAAVFAYNNPQAIDVDIGFMRIEQVPDGCRLRIVFACGWVFGVLSALLSLLRMASNERRRLRKDLRFAEAELASLARDVPLNDAN